ncbi:MAG: tetratricopeptide repeat protein [Bacteroidia bacterium]
MKRLIFLFCLILPQWGNAAGNAFVFTPALVEAYHHILALRFDKGLALLETERKKNPASPALAFISDYHFFLKSFISEDVKAFESEIAAFESRLDILEKGDNTSPYYNYCQAELLVHQAALRFKFRDYVRGANNVRDAYSLLEKNIRLYPTFKPHYKSMGMLQVLVGTVPPKFAWVTNMLGMEGDIEAGMQKINTFRKAPYLNPETEMLKEEALFLYSFLQLHIVKEKEESWKEIEAATRDYRTNLLHCYARASVGMHCKKTDEVITTLKNRPKGEEYARFYFLDYMLGSAYLYKQDSNAAICLKIFVSLFKGENYIKDAYRKLAWHYLCAGDETKYAVYMSLAERNGRDQVDEDKDALKEAASGVHPEPRILKARLLFDGGYYSQALAILLPLSNEKWKRSKDNVEYIYRLARTYHETREEAKAISQYLKTIELGKSQTWYFAANSSLQLGFIYEKRGQYTMASYYFKQAMNFPNDEYKTSIDQKAKAGLQRIAGK